MPQALIDDIVFAAEADAEACAALHAQCFPHGWSYHEFKVLLAMPGMVAVAALHKTTLIGLLLLRTVLDEAEVITLCVRDSYRRSGLAKQLMLQGDAALRKMDVASLYLEVEKDNDAAKQLYAHAGFSESGMRKDYYGADRHALVMSRQLS